jgi:hypothetical protein
MVWYGLFRVTNCVVFPFLALCNTVAVCGRYLSHAGDRISKLSRSWLDSLGTVELVMAFEEEFAVEIPNAEADKISSCSEVIG